MSREKERKVVTDENNSSQEDGQQNDLSDNSGVTRRDILKKAAWMVPVILSTQLSGKTFAQQPISCVQPGDTDCTKLNQDHICSACETYLCDTNCEYCDNLWWDIL